MGRYWWLLVGSLAGQKLQNGNESWTNSVWKSEMRKANGAGLSEPAGSSSPTAADAGRRLLKDYTPVGK